MGIRGAMSLEAFLYCAFWPLDSLHSNITVTGSGQRVLLGVLIIGLLDSHI